MDGQMTGWRAEQMDRQMDEWTVGQINKCELPVDAHLVDGKVGMLGLRK